MMQPLVACRVTVPFNASKTDRFVKPPSSVAVSRGCILSLLAACLQDCEVVNGCSESETLWTEVAKYFGEVAETPRPSLDEWITTSSASGSTNDKTSRGDDTSFEIPF